jgi:hypothetical protein
LRIIKLNNTQKLRVSSICLRAGVFLLPIFKECDATKRRPILCNSFLRKILLPVGKIAIQKGRWLNTSARKGKTPGSNRVRRAETAICIYGLKEKIRARKSPETVDAPGFSPDASIPFR